MSRKRDFWDTLEAIAETVEPTSAKQTRQVAAIVYKGRILSVGTNRHKTHPLMLQFNKHPESIYLHAEIDAIVRVLNKFGAEILKECSMHVLRLTLDGERALSAPCTGCAAAIVAFGIREVFHT